MPFVDGVQATLQLKRRQSSPPVLALTTFDDDQALAGMLRLRDRAAAVVLAFAHDLGKHPG
jgi:DNA-binding NarL/FixJ family response regulator